MAKPMLDNGSDVVVTFVSLVHWANNQKATLQVLHKVPKPSTMDLMDDNT